MRARSGSRGTPSEGCSRGDTPSGWFFQPPVCHPQKGWGLAPDHQLEATKSAHQHEALPDGENLKSQGCPEKERSPDKGRFERCLSYCTNLSPSLRFNWKTSYQFKVLPFGLATAPRIFMKLLQPVVAHLREQEIRLLIYLDVMAKSQEEAWQHTQVTISLLQSLGFVLNSKKCQLDPSSSMECLGFIVNTNSMMLSLPERKVHKILKECPHLRQKTQPMVRDLSHMIGLCPQLPQPSFKLLYTTEACNA